MSSNTVYAYDQPTITDTPYDVYGNKSHTGSNHQPGAYQPPATNNQSVALGQIQGQSPTVQVTHHQVYQIVPPDNQVHQKGPSDSGIILAICVTLCCCWPLGACAIKRASQVSLIVKKSFKKSTTPSFGVPL